ncbi:MAG TPA: glycosyl hydrolase 108 family protein [Aliidongia sp.]|uniref:glycoside hydrolase family 108 protein n=1 Tax=Aliidongia sp. TaxID=1914230 RepID=UPI002DDD3348|nr:glycosyl hydrolase 108 family protein [Aliidongia sp.]HEV2673373.1 glycosyl hydrolase 108 family protein [Aliidongia sp.]
MSGAAPQGDATFRAAIAIVLMHEGGLVDDPDDAGGLTNMGITLRDHPALGADGIRNLTREDAIAIYWTDWWVRYRFGQLPASIAGKVFDLAVNVGAGTAVAGLQRAVNALGHHLVVDGAIGAQTCQAALGCDPRALHAAFAAQMAAHYRAIVAAHPADAKFLAGWLARAAA